jgi:HAD superfamily hydrolase (TIGR01509 family)
MLKAIIFDLDGTIIDTETTWYIALNEHYQHYGAELSLELYSTCIGTDLAAFNPYTYLINELNVQVDPVEFKEMVRQRYNDLMENEQIRPGVKSYLEQARSAGLKLALASSSDRAWVEKHLQQLGLLEYFDVIRTADDVSKVKPDPELYEQTLLALGVRPEEAVAIEDSPNGARAAVAAGLPCLVTPNTITRTLPFDISHRRLNSLDELDFNELLTKPFIYTEQ